jgi:hypothetical protein
LAYHCFSFFAKVGVIFYTYNFLEKKLKMWLMWICICNKPSRAGAVVASALLGLGGFSQQVVLEG